MFNSAVIDLVLILSFTYFVMSLLVLTIHEYVFSILTRKRAKFLNRAIQNLFFSDGWKYFVTDKLYNNVHLETLMGKKRRFPSYIPAENFALALMDQLRDENSVLDLQRIKTVILDNEKTKEIGLPEDLQKFLVSLLERAKGSIDLFQKNIEIYFDNAMDRAAGIYKRSVQIFIAFISLLVAGTLNVDSIHIAKTLWENPDAMKHTVDNIATMTRELQNDSSGKFTIRTTDNKVIIQTKALKIDTTGADSVNIGKSPIEQVKQTELYLDHAGIPLGWTVANMPPGDFNENTREWLIKLAGIILTTIALMLGAPFWFDLINKVTNLRMTGKKPDSTSDKPVPGTSPVVVNVIPPPGEEAAG